MKLKPISKRGQLSLGDAPSVVLIVGFIFLVMATIAFIGEKFSDAVGGDTSVAGNITIDLNDELANNTSIAGIVLTISLVGIVLSVLIGVFVVARNRGL